VTVASRRRRLSRRQLTGGSVPYLLVLPVVAVLGAILGYPIYDLVRLSLQKYDLFALLQHHGVSVGLHNFGIVLHDPVFWHTLLRTVVFTVVNVGLTIVGGTLIALLLVRVSTWVRLLLTVGLVLVWAMPQVVAVQVWYWMTNYQNGVVNYVLTRLHLGNFFQHDWYATTFSQLSLTTTLIVWGALPFVVITLRIHGASRPSASATPPGLRPSANTAWAPRPRPSSRNSSVIADGSTGRCSLHWRNSISREPMPRKEIGTKAARLTTISSPPGRTRARISRYFVKPKPNTRNSPQPHLSPLQHRGKSNSPVFLKYSSLMKSPEVRAGG